MIVVKEWKHLQKNGLLILRMNNQGINTNHLLLKVLIILINLKWLKIYYEVIQSIEVIIIEKDWDYLDLKEDLWDHNQPIKKQWIS